MRRGGRSSGESIGEFDVECLEFVRDDRRGMKMMMVAWWVVMMVMFVQS